MSRIALVSLIGALLTLPACDLLERNDDTTPPPAQVSEPTVVTEPSLPEREQVAQVESSIDWEAARADLAAIPSDERDGAFQVASGTTAPPVPVLLPTGIVIPQGVDSQPRFQPLSDGYYAAYPGIDYDIIVNGTNETVAGTSEIESQIDKDALIFQPTSTGAMVSFSKYGADYLVEFECKGADGASPDCISEADALKIAQDLIIAGTR